MLAAQTLEQQLKQLLLPTFAKRYVDLATQCEAEQKSFIDYLSLLCQEEIECRHTTRIAKLLKESRLPRSKHLNEFDFKRIPDLSPSLVQTLARGDFIDRYENILIFGNPGTGKTHLSIGLAREWCLQGRRVYFTSVVTLVQQLVRAKRELLLTQLIKRLGQYEVLLIDDISYIPFDRTETDALFALLSERYETRSTLITSNVPFAQWSTFFKDEMTAAAVIDRLVHHSVILELNAQSYRMAEAKNKLPTDAKNRPAENHNTETQNKLPENANSHTADHQNKLQENITNKEEA